MASFIKDVMLLFCRGKLFASPWHVVRILLGGVAITAAVLVAVALVGRSVWLAAALAGFVGGVLQPYLSKNVKFR